MDWSGVDYCDVFISCLDSHSDGTHSLQRIHWWDTDAETHFTISLNVLLYKLNTTSFKFSQLLIFYSVETSLKKTNEKHTFNAAEKWAVGAHVLWSLIKHRKILKISLRWWWVRCWCFILVLRLKLPCIIILWPIDNKLLQLFPWKPNVQWASQALLLHKRQSWIQSPLKRANHSSFEWWSSADVKPLHRLGM